jgi:hypothetical protein
MKALGVQEDYIAKNKEAVKALDVALDAAREARLDKPFIEAIERALAEAADPTSTLRAALKDARGRIASIAYNYPGPSDDKTYKALRQLEEDLLTVYSRTEDA